MVLIRRLQLRTDEGIVDVLVSITDPVEVRGSWFSTYEVAWPDGTARDDIWGADAIQALYLTMQALALAIYASAHHQSGRLTRLYGPRSV